MPLLTASDVLVRDSSTLKMKSPFAQALFVSIVAGVATALMSGFVLRSSAPTLMLTMLAPAPLMIAGFGWHPLCAALGGIVAALIAQGATSTHAALIVSGMLAVPAYGVTALALNRFSMFSQRPQRDGKEMGGIGVLVVIFLALTAVLAAMAVEPDFEAMTRRLKAAMELVMREVLFQTMGLGPGLPHPRPEGLSKIYEVLAAIILPMSALVTLTTLIISATLAAQVAERAGLLAYPRPDYRRFAVPGGGLILMGLSFFVATRSGYLGVLGDTVFAGMLFLFLLQGLAVIHVRSIGFPGRGLLLFLVWGCLIVFGLPAFLFMLVGVFDHLLDFRRGRL